MTNYIIFLVTIFLVSNNIFAQDSKVDIQGIVKKQIQNAREKSELKNKPVPKIEQIKKSDLTKKITKTDDYSEVINKFEESSNTNQDLFLIGFVVFDVIGISLISIVIFIRKRRKSVIAEQITFRKSIKQIRENRIPDKNSDVLSDIRKRITKALISTKISDQDVTLTAKHFSISKGELYLAAKIKELELEYVATSNK